MSVVIETTLGDITVDLYLEQRPRTCLNFLKLCKIKYYNLCVFHKVERNFIAQTGDPTQTGRGGESIFCRLYGEQAKYFDTELKPRLKHEKLGTLSMVNNGNNMNGAQFFITLGENLTYLDEVHTVFGEVAEGLGTLLKINEAICDPNDRPYQDIRITHTVILHDSYEDPTGLDIPPSSPTPTKEQLQSNYIGADEEIDDTKGKNMEEIEEKIKESEAKARATILEMVGDIPDADVKPPENVLFVCKLNPVTTSEDLEVIFSRFGSIVSCEVIKDSKTDESLQYAFIEFENEEDCESAYFKMDNVLIDDRRIHVDFSQSVSKMKFVHAQSQKKQSLVLKNKNKNQDNYDMIFDLDDNNASKEVVHSQEEKQQKFNKNSMHKEKKDCRPNSSEKHSDDMSNYKKSKKSKSDSRTNRSRSCDRQSRYGNSMHGSKKEKSHFSRTSELKQLDLRHKTKVPTAHRPKSYSSSHTLKVSTKPLFDAEQFSYKGKKRSSSVSSNSSSSNKDIIKKSAKKLNIEKSSDRTTKKQKPQQQYSSSSSDSSSSSSSSSPSKKSIKKKSSDVSSKKKTHKKRYSSSSSDSSSSSSSTSDSSTPSEKNSKRSKTKRKESIPKSTQSGKSYKTKEESMESDHASKKHKIRTELKYCRNDSDTLRSSSSVNLPRKREERSRAPHYDKQSYRSKARSRSPR